MRKQQKGETMNGNPNAAQKRYHDELREMYFDRFGGRGELHHVFGSKWKRKGYLKPGEWIVILLTPEVHHEIKKYSFEAERGMFLNQLREYEMYFGKRPPVPEGLVASYREMLNRHDTTKGLPNV